MKKSNLPQERQLLSPKEVAKILMVSPITVRQWAQKDKLKAYTTAGGHRRFDLKDVEEFAHKNNVKTPTTNQLKVLIIDDDESYLKLIGHMIDSIQTDKKILIDTATNGFDGGLKVQAFKPDILLLDLKMQRMNGFEVCKQVKASPETTHIRILTMTGFANQESTEKILQLGAEACLTKPIKLDVLIKHLGISETQG